MTFWSLILAWRLCLLSVVPLCYKQWAQKIMLLIFSSRFFCVLMACKCLLTHRMQCSSCRLRFGNSYFLCFCSESCLYTHEYICVCVCVYIYIYIYSFWYGYSKTLKSPLDCQEIKSVNPKGSQPWIFIGRTVTEAEAPMLWTYDANSWLIGKDLVLGKFEGKRRRGDRGWDG